MRVKVPKPTRTFLEMDELVALIDAAADQESRSAGNVAEPRGESAAAVAARWSRGMRPSDIAAELGLSKATGQLSPATPGSGGSGELRRPPGHRRHAGRLLHAREGAMRRTNPRLAPARRHRRALPDPRRAKSEAGIREVQVSPDLVDELVTHLDNLRRAGRSTPDAYLLPNLRGGRMSRQRAAEIVGKAAVLATERQTERGLPALPNDDATHAPPDLHLDRAAGEPLRRALGHEPGGPRRLEDDDGRLRAATAARRPRARPGVRRPRPASPRPSLSKICASELSRIIP
jgi:hypothetical protein